MEKIKSLVAMFENGEGKTHCWRFSNIESTKTSDLYEALERLTTAVVFDAQGIEIFHSVKKAWLSETSEQMIFGVVNDSDREVFTDDASVQMFERLLPVEADVSKLTLMEKVVLFLGYCPPMTQLTDLCFEGVTALEEEVGEDLPQVLLRGAENAVL